MLPDLIHTTQTGFVPGRLSFENLTFTQDLLDWARSTHHPLYIAFLDFEKAFDRVDWWYRNEVLRTLGFPPSLIHMINALYNEASLQLIINGELSDTITQTRGVRQGCPISPFIFAMFVEPLGELMRDHQQELGICLPKPRTHARSQHALITSFADDTTLYSDQEAKLAPARTTFGHN